MRSVAKFEGLASQPNARDSLAKVVACFERDKAELQREKVASRLLSARLHRSPRN